LAEPNYPSIEKMILKVREAERLDSELEHKVKLRRNDLKEKFANTVQKWTWESLRARKTKKP
jgi:hypothetical protein